RHGEPLHRQPAICLRQRESAEINGLFESDIDRLELRVLLRADVVLDSSTPCLTRVERREGRPESDLDPFPPPCLPFAPIRRSAPLRSDSCQWGPLGITAATYHSLSSAIPCPEPT